MEAFFEQRAALKRTGLIGCPGAKLRIAAAGSEIGVAFLIGDPRDGALDTDLAAQAFPVEQQSGLRIGEQFLRLPAFEVGVEDETPRVMAFEQHHADRWTALGVGCRQRHGVAVIGLAAPGLSIPGVEQGVGIGVGHARSLRQHYGKIEIDHAGVCSAQVT